jgi:hypothetical protein
MMFLSIVSLHCRAPYWSTDHFLYLNSPAQTPLQVNP